MKVSLYRTKAGFAALTAWYERALAALSVARESVTVATRFGDTHAIVAGPRGGAPVVLLHGTNANALMWKPQLPALAESYRVHALDVIGSAGWSAPARRPGPATASGSPTRSPFWARARPPRRYLYEAAGSS